MLALTRCDSECYRIKIIFLTSPTLRVGHVAIANAIALKQISSRRRSFRVGHVVIANAIALKQISSRRQPFRVGHVAIANAIALK